MTAPGQGLTCTSASAEAGAQLRGIRGAGGRIVPVRTQMTEDAGFVKAARAFGAAEARMRFTGACREGGARNGRKETAA